VLHWSEVKRKRAGVLLIEVPIEYMSGVNAAAFVVGDRVVVAFANQSWSSPKVTGFESNPRGLLGYLLISYLDAVANFVQALGTRLMTNAVGGDDFTSKVYLSTLAA
jgi:hypothetical protein